MKRNIVLFTGIQRFCKTLKERGYSIAVLRERGEQLNGRKEVDYTIDYDPEDLDELMEKVRGLPYRNEIVTVMNRRERRRSSSHGTRTAPFFQWRYRLQMLPTVWEMWWEG